MQCANAGGEAELRALGQKREQMQQEARELIH
jgi:hypothetical protein